MLDAQRECWTPDLVAEALVDAVRWARYCAGPAGPRGYAAARLPIRAATLEDHLAEGWGLPETAGDDEGAAEREALRLHYRLASPAAVQRHLDALGWIASHVAPACPLSARVAQAWLASKVGGPRFRTAVQRLPGLCRSEAYRRKDRALGLIAIALEASRTPVRVG